MVAIFWLDLTFPSINHEPVISNTFDYSKKLLIDKRLYNIAVCPKLIALSFVLAFARARQYNDWQESGIVISSDITQNMLAVEPREVEVQDNQGWKAGWGPFRIPPGARQIL